MHDAALLIFTKTAIPGRVKTRLIGQLSADQAADLHRAFVEDLVDRLLAGPFDVELAWALLENEPLPTSSLVVRAQQGEDLGQRLYRGLAAAATEHSLIAAVGSDHPELPLEHAVEAFAALRDGHDVALGPAEDGGYYLVAVRRESLTPRLFEGIEWSTSRVFGQTLDRCRELGSSVHLLPQGADVDRPADLERLVSRLAAGEAHCPRTAELFASWGMEGSAT